MSQIYKLGSGGGGSGIIQTINGDIGSITGATVTIFANNSTNNSGSTVLFNNSGTVSTLNVTDGLGNTFIGLLSGNSSISGSGNTGLGFDAGAVISSANNNTLIGGGSGSHLTTGSQNVALGELAGSVWLNGTETNNVALGNQGIVGDNNIIRLGVPVTGGSQTAHTANFQGGISGVTVAASSPIAITANGQISDLGFGTSGQVLTSNGAATSPTWQPAGSTTYFQAYRTSNQTIAGGSTASTIVFDTAISNVGSAYNTGTGVFTAPATGFYSFSSTVFFNNLNTPVGNTQVILAYTGSVQSLRMIEQGIGSYSGGTSIILNIAWAMPMTAGNTVQIQPFADGAGNYTIAGGALSSSAFNTSSTFSGFRVA
jgi:hypothetical protein